MRGFVASTDYEWFTFLRSIAPPVDEVNFWRPGADAGFRALRPGEPLFFKLKVPYNAIGGFGFFAHYSRLPVSMAWEIYGQGNGAPSFPAIRERLLRLRNRFDMDANAKQDFWIGCILINQPTFFADDDWVRMPDGWSSTIGQGQGYDLSSGEGRRIWMECLARGTSGRERGMWLTPDPGIVAEQSPFETPTVVYPRLGPRSFRVAVLDSYGRGCAVTSERTLPALEAVHIRDYQDLPSHSINNGILFRADIHKLFDAGYVTVTPDHRFEVSGRIREEFENGHEYYELHGSSIRLPENPLHRPAVEALWWHNEQRYLG